MKSLHRIGSFLVMLSLVILLPGCDGIRGKLLVMEGNMMESRSRYNQAISSYTDALSQGESAPYADFGLGVVYLKLGEDDAALKRFGSAGEIIYNGQAQNDKELNYRIHYNRGIIFFHAGDFTGAAAEFRSALEIDSGRIEAKRNLELSLLSIKNQSTSAAGASPVNITAEEGRPDTVFEYLRQKEEDQWKSQESAEDKNPPGLDY